MNPLSVIQLLDLNAQDYLANYWRRKYGEDNPEYLFRLAILTAYNHASKCEYDSNIFCRQYSQNVETILQKEWQEILRGWNEIINN